VSTGFEKLGLMSNGALATPKDPAKVGWFAAGTSPGVTGPAVIAGHVTWNGPAVFYKLGKLQRGAHVLVNRADGTTAVFAVESMHTFGKDTFPTKKVYRYTDHPELVMITCGGKYHASKHYYDDDLIVRAKLVSHRG
jgi:sortase (surface protein transpeptidase)